MNAPLVARPVRRMLFLLAAVLGVAADLLLDATPWDARVGLWLALVLGGFAAFAYREEIQVPRAAWIWFGLAVAVAGLLGVRAAPFLTNLTLVGVAGCLVMAGWTARGGTPFFAPVLASLTESAATALHITLGGAGCFAPDPSTPPRIAGASPSSVPRILIGVVLTTPLLLFFGTLFASADPVFRKGIEAVTDVDLSWVGQHTLVIGITAWALAGYGCRLLFRAEFASAGIRPPAPPARAPGIEVVTGLSLIALLFLGFVLVQLRYLFGDDDLVRTTVGMSYAEYARQGFFELFAVAAMLLPILLLADWLLLECDDRRALRGLMTALVLLLAVVLVSAFRRMHLYTAAYGWTELRLYATAALTWMAAVTVIFAFTVVRADRLRFAGPSFVAALVVLGALHVVNPDSFVARSQLTRTNEGHILDVDHIATLGPDAIPHLVEALPRLSEPEQRRILEALRAREIPAAWNLGWARAAQSLRPLQTTE